MLIFIVLMLEEAEKNEGEKKTEIYSYLLLEKKKRWESYQWDGGVSCQPRTHLDTGELPHGRRQTRPLTRRPCTNDQLLRTAWLQPWAAGMQAPEVAYMSRGWRSGGRRRHPSPCGHTAVAATQGLDIRRHCPETETLQNHVAATWCRTVWQCS